MSEVSHTPTGKFLCFFLFKFPVYLEIVRCDLNNVVWGCSQISYFSYQMGVFSRDKDRVKTLAMTGYSVVSTFKLSRRWYEIVIAVLNG